tara:strand:- start:703 stop:957 length:255 start_codon:yes stop_codon:yes gene_type:complete
METTVIIFFLLIILTIYWSFRGLVGLFQRHNPIVIIIYILFLFPIAYIHMLFLGIFGSSKEDIIRKKAKEKADFEKLVDEERKK